MVAEKNAHQNKISKRELKTKKRIVFAALFFSLFVLISCNGEELETEPDYPVVETLTVVGQPFRDWIMTIGRIEAISDALLRAEMPGTVIQMAEEGQQVEAGDVIMQTDPEQAEAVLRQAQAAIEETETSIDQIEDEIERMEPLAADTIVSPLEMNQLRSQRSQLEANLQQAQAAVREAEQAYEQTYLRAPFDGLIEERWVRTGEQISTGQEVARIIGPSMLEATAGISERFSGDIQQGSEAIVQLHSYGIEDIESTVRVVGTAINPENRTFPIRISIDDPDNVIKADMIARIRVARETLENALVVPPAVVQRDQHGESLLVVSETNDTLAIVERRRVLTGPRSEEGVVIEEGILEGEEIIVTGLTEAVAEDTVRIERRYSNIEEYRSIIEEEMQEARPETPEVQQP